MILICDENIGPRVTEGLRNLGFDALAFGDLGWLGEPDVMWLPKASAIADSLVMTRDRTILRKPEELQAVVNGNIGIVFLTGGQLPAGRMIRVLSENWRKLEELHNSTPRPFIRFLTNDGNLRERLHGRGL